MDSVDLLARIERRARLHGPNETRRALCATIEALGGVLPRPVLQSLLISLPAEIGEQLPAGPAVRIESCREFVAVIAGRLHLDQPDAAFLARVVFEHLNDPAYGMTPASVAHLTPADLRPLLSAAAARPMASPPARRPLAPKPELGTIIEFPRPVREPEIVRELHPA